MEVEHQDVGWQQLGRDGCLVGVAAHGAGVDEDVRLGQLGLDDRVVPGACLQVHVGGAAGKVLDQALATVQVAVEQGDVLEAQRDERVDHRAAAAAGADDDGVARHLLVAHQLVERSLEADDVGVVADQLVAVAGDGVDRAGRLGLIREPVEHRRHAILVRMADVGAQELLPTKCLDGLGQVDRGRVDGLVVRIDPGSGEGCLLQCLGQRMGDRLAEQDDSFRHDHHLPGSRATRARSVLAWGVSPAGG